MVGKRTLLTELINLINEIQFKLKNNHSFDWTPTPEINLAQVDPPVQLQALFCLMTHHWSIKQNNFYRITRTYFGVRSSGQRSAGTFPTCLPDGQKSQKIHRKAWDGRIQVVSYNRSVSDHPEGFQTFFPHLEGLSGTYPPISTSDESHKNDHNNFPVRFIQICQKKLLSLPTIGIPGLKE